LAQFLAAQCLSWAGDASWFEFPGEGRKGKKRLLRVVGADCGSVMTMHGIVQSFGGLAVCGYCQEAGLCFHLVSLNGHRKSLS